MGTQNPLCSIGTMKLQSVLFLLVCLVACCAGTTRNVNSTPGQWSYLQKDWAAIALGIDFVSDSEGWVVGGTGAGSPLILHTSNSGMNFTNQNTTASHGAFLDCAMSSPTHGLAGGIGLFGAFPCGVYTVDGKTWQVPDEGFEFVCTVTNAAAPSDGSLIQIGTFFSVLHSGGGVYMSTDNGKKWKHHKWTGGNIDGVNTQPQYGSFLSKDLGFISGGLKASVNMDVLTNRRQSYPISKMWNFDAETQRVLFNRHWMKSAGPDANGYVTIVQKVTSEGSSFTTLFNITNGGQEGGAISCPDENTCWLITYGINNSTGAAGSWIYSTTDGGNNWDLKMTTPWFLSTIHAVNASYVWVGGIDTEGGEGTDGVFFLSTDSFQSYSLSNPMPNFAPFQISYVDETHLYATGVNAVGLSSLVAYSVS